MTRRTFTIPSGDEGHSGSHASTISFTRPVKGFDRTRVRRITVEAYRAELDAEERQENEVCAKNYGEGVRDEEAEGRRSRKQRKLEETPFNRGSLTSTSVPSYVTRPTLLRAKDPNTVFSSKYPIYNRFGRELCVLYQMHDIDVSNELYRVRQKGKALSGEEKNRVSGVRCQSDTVPSMHWMSMRHTGAVSDPQENRASKPVRREPGDSSTESSSVAMVDQTREYHGPKEQPFHREEKEELGFPDAHRRRKDSISSAVSVPSRCASSRPSVFSLYRDSRQTTVDEPSKSASRPTARSLSGGLGDVGFRGSAAAALRGSPSPAPLEAVSPSRTQSLAPTVAPPAEEKGASIAHKAGVGISYTDVIAPDVYGGAKQTSVVASLVSEATEALWRTQLAQKDAIAFPASPAKGRCRVCPGPAPVLEPGAVVELGDGVRYRILGEQSVTSRMATPQRASTSPTPTASSVFRAVEIGEDGEPTRAVREALLYRWRHHILATIGGKSQSVYREETTRASVGLQWLIEPWGEFECRGYVFDGEERDGLTVLRLPSLYAAVSIGQMALMSGPYTGAVRLFLKMILSFLSRRMVHGSLNDLDHVWLAVRRPNSCEGEGSTLPAVVMLPVHWEHCVDFRMFADRRVGREISFQFDDMGGTLHTTPRELRQGSDLRSVLHELLEMRASRELPYSTYRSLQQLMLSSSDPNLTHAQLIVQIHKVLCDLPSEDGEGDDRNRATGRGENDADEARSSPASNASNSRWCSLYDYALAKLTDGSG